MIKSYKDLVVWQKSITLVQQVYELSKDFPKSEFFGLSQQLRRSAVSVPSNIAEGYGRGSRNDYLRFCKIARGSCFELETQIIIAIQLKMVNKVSAENVTSLINEVCRLLQGLINSLENGR